MYLARRSADGGADRLRRPIVVEPAGYSVRAPGPDLGSARVCSTAEDTETDRRRDAWVDLRPAAAGYFLPRDPVRRSRGSPDPQAIPGFLAGAGRVPGAGDSNLENLPSLKHGASRVRTGSSPSCSSSSARQLGDLESTIDALPSLFDLVTAPAPVVTWLSSWMAFHLIAELLDGSDSAPSTGGSSSGRPRSTACAGRLQKGRTSLKSTMAFGHTLESSGLAAAAAPGRPRLGFWFGPMDRDL